MQARDDHGVELQPLGLVDGHDLQALIRRGIRQGEQALYGFGELCRVGDLAGFLVFGKAIEIDVDVLDVTCVHHATRAAQREPGGLHACAQAAAQGILHNGRKRFAQTRKSRCAITREALRRRADSLPEGWRSVTPLPVDRRSLCRFKNTKEILLAFAAGRRTGGIASRKRIQIRE